MECSTCAFPSGSTCRIPTRSKPGTDSTPEARWVRKECNTRPDRFYRDIGLPSSFATRNRAENAARRSSRSRPVPSTSPTDRSGGGGVKVDHDCRGSGVCQTEASPELTRPVPMWVPIPRDNTKKTRTKVKDAGGAERRNSRVFTFLCILGTLETPTQPSCVFSRV